MNCLWCDADIVPDTSWRNIILVSKPKNLCPSCTDQLTVLQGKRCVKCSRLSEKEMCPDCMHWERSLSQEDPLTWNYSVFSYNEAMKEMITRWKYRGDYCLGKAFEMEYRKAFKRNFSFLPKEAVAVPIPLSEERMHERGFNQSKMLASFLPLKRKDILTRIHGEKQSKKTRRQRVTAVNPFQMKGSINNPVILADDIYTTGTTLRHAATALKKHGCPAVYALTLIRG
ncbi:competence protein ComFC [Lentibacillus halodurans]|uniref:Competence protein ComFC n=1 Tax=Lentibacillus halodurans TaxID=237679 RepID=A0A1I0WIU3_9BACI|nr:ComF family protein [Lentibacillus halodurans]SFA88148.1 competence protein ComFC [Lentibacillus halodurans]